MSLDNSNELKASYENYGAFLLFWKQVNLCLTKRGAADKSNLDKGHSGKSFSILSMCHERIW